MEEVDLTSPQSLLEFPTVKKYLSRISAEPRSLTRAVVKQEHGNGYYTDLALIKFTKTGDVDAPDGYQPTDDERRYIQVEMSGAQWPEIVFIPENDPALPDKAKNADAENLYWFRDISGNIIMGQVRRVNRDGTKNYFPLTKWSDGEYRWIEPDGDLPLWGQEQLKTNSTVFIHEGCRSAIHALKVANGEIDHPWQVELSHAAHVAFIGGALAPHRTDWSVLKRAGISRAIIVADNDAPGISAIPKIARELDCVTMSIQFTDQFKRSCDIADSFPDSMFSELNGKKFYVGPSFRECTHPSTWMTNLVPVTDDKGKVKLVPVLRQHAKSQWAYIEELELFISTEFPEIVRKAQSLDAMLMPFSDTRRTSELLLSSYTGRTPRLTYRPDIKGRRVVSNGETAINTYVPPSIKPQAGDASPWHEYIAYLIPDENEAYELKRWCATLIARPDIRLSYAVLLASTETGIGKTTLGERVLAPLVGLHNASFPSEENIVDSQFNEWIGRKRLAVCNEIYAGASFKAANRLKSLITDSYVQYNEKYMPVIKLENYISILACSNSQKALMLESHDRRWFVPTVSEVMWKRKKFEEFFSWLKSGGLQIIAHWAETFDNYVMPGERAPMTEKKQNLIHESMTVAESEVYDLTESATSENMVVAFAMNELFSWATQKVRGSVFDRAFDLQKVAKQNSFEVWNGKDRLYVYGRLQAVLLSPALRDKVSSMTRDEARDYVKSMVKLPGEVMGGL